jgi:hypothetical protein
MFANNGDIIPPSLASLAFALTLAFELPLASLAFALTLAFELRAKGAKVELPLASLAFALRAKVELRGALARQKGVL